MANSLNSSYFYGMDTVYNWGNRSYFTFFSEFNRPWNGIGVIEALIYIVIFLISVVANILIIIRVLRVRQLKTVTNCFIANLAMADLLFSSGCPFIAVVRITGTWVLGGFFCHIIIYLEFVCMFAVIWTMTVISIERFFCIVKPNCCRISLTMAIVIVILIWVIAFAGFLPMATFFNIYAFPFGNDTIQICTLVWPSNTTVQVSIVFVSCLVLVGFIVPLALMTHNYYRVFRTFWISRQTIIKKECSSSQPTVNMAVQPAASTLRSHSSKLVSHNMKVRSLRSLRVIRILVLLVLLFFLMWLPIFIAFIVIQYDGAYEYHQMHSWMLITSSYFAFANTCVNPFVYVFINERFRITINFCRKTSKEQPKADEIASFSASELLGSASFQQTYRGLV
ncbi:free fatty acid receptor 4-like isoform X2 [Octopus sinensis]|uniref:Free fatty acid receptor 4-like isoform X2 n=1 Tax=Octopus sinensis TaxID=2607531 RepID=A0A6P7U064_9MOLL|nr:free fatty acid receptor 4-like isoform X2 [Octopus sinensis]